MDKYLDYTWDPVKFPVQVKDAVEHNAKGVFLFTNWHLQQVRNFVDRLHSQGQHFVVIDDCGIANISNYDAYEKGLQLDVFIKQSNGRDGIYARLKRSMLTPIMYSGRTPFIGRVWPGFTAWPDFLHPNADAYWSALIRDFLKTVPVDGTTTEQSPTSIALTMRIIGLWVDMNEPSNFCDGYCPDLNPPPNKEGFDANNPPYAINNHGCRYVTPSS